MKKRLYPSYRTGWVTPTHNGYRMRCCDCDLVHVIHFRVISHETGRFTSKGSVAFRVERDNRATAACRRETKKRSK